MTWGWGRRMSGRVQGWHRVGSTTALARWPKKENRRLCATSSKTSKWLARTGIPLRGEGSCALAIRNHWISCPGEHAARETETERPVRGWGSRRTTAWRDCSPSALEGVVTRGQGGLTGEGGTHPLEVRPPDEELAEEKLGGIHDIHPSSKARRTSEADLAGGEPGPGAQCGGQCLPRTSRLL
jgi:hypothetical protein